MPVEAIGRQQLQISCLESAIRALLCSLGGLTVECICASSPDMLVSLGTVMTLHGRTILGSGHLASEEASGEIQDSVRVQPVMCQPLWI